MKIIQSSKNIELDFKIRYPLDKICFMDIETTGLSKNYHQIYLIGILSFDSKTYLWKLTQFFGESKSEEESVLKAFMKEIKKYKYLITYNGNNFDIPFINEKLKKYDMKEIDMESVDLYKVLRENKDFIDFPNLKLKTVEQELGINREDPFTGLECIEFYKNYLITRSDNFLYYILNHNRDDLYSMPNLLKIFQIIEENGTIIIELLDKHISLELISVKQSGDLIIVNGKWQDSLNYSAEFYNRFYSFSLNKNLDFKMKIEVNLAKLEKDVIAYYVDTMDFGLNLIIKDLSGHNPPDNILILKVNKKNILDNIKNLVKVILESENLNINV